MLLGIVNLEKWNSLPKNYQSILEQAGQAANSWMASTNKRIRLYFFILFLHKSMWRRRCAGTECSAALIGSLELGAQDAKINIDFIGEESCCHRVFCQHAGENQRWPKTIRLAVLDQLGISR